MTRRDCFLAWPMLALAAPSPSPTSAELLEKVRTGMQEVMGYFPPVPRGKPEFQVLETEKTPKYTRTKIRYAANTTDRVPAYLLVPHNAHLAPAMLCLHQTTKIGKAEPAGLGGKPNLHYAHELAERGYITLAPDYLNFGEYDFDPYSHGFLSASMKGIWNHARGVDLLCTMGEQVNLHRVGVIGHSLGGHNALFLAAFEPRLRVVVTSCGFTSFRKYMKGDLTGWSHKGYMPRIATAYKTPDRMPFDFPELLASLAPRHVFVNAPKRDSNFDLSGVEDCVRFARPYLGDNLQVVHPDCEHDFPPEVRQQAYRFIEKALQA